MSKNTKIWLIVAACLITTGLILFTATLMANNWDFTKLGTSKYETHTYTLDKAFSKIHIYTDEADIVIARSEGNTCKVVCHERNNTKHIVGVENDALYIRVGNDKKWYEYIGINFGTPKITVLLPQSQYDALFINSSTSDVSISEEFQFHVLDISVSTGDVTSFASATDSIKIATSTGDIRLENASAENLNLNVSTGDISLTDVECVSLNTKGSTGDIYLKNVIATQLFSIERSTGDVKFDSCDAPEIFVTTDTGDVTGTLLSEKVFVTKTSTGNIKVPQSTSGGKCNITTSTGDIKIAIG